jgi:hypothetical protein
MNSKKESAMSLKSHVVSMANDLEQRAEELPERVEDARKAVEQWGGRARIFVRKNPGAALVGAFAIGFALAKVARHA